jgi:hypothetical protein
MTQQTDLGEEFDVVGHNRPLLHSLRERTLALNLVDITDDTALCHSSNCVRCIPFSATVSYEEERASAEAALLSLVERTIKYLEETDLEGQHVIAFEVEASERDSSFHVELTLRFYELPQDDQ